MYQTQQPQGGIDPSLGISHMDPIRRWVIELSWGWFPLYSDYLSQDDYLQVYRFIWNLPNFIFLYRWRHFYCPHGPYFHYPFLSWWTSRLLPFPGYCELSGSGHGWADASVVRCKVLWYMPQSTRAGFCGRPSLAFLRDLHTDFYRGCTILNLQFCLFA